MKLATPATKIKGATAAFRGSILDFHDDPRRAADAARFVEDGILLVRDGRIEARGSAAAVLPQVPPGVQVTDYSGRLIVPGFVDAHIHYPQTDIIASHGKRLLDWLNDYTFPAEGAFADEKHAASVADFFLDELLRNGTTTAVVYPTVHKGSVNAFFTAAERRNLRMLCGKVLMDRNAPAFLRDEAESAYRDCQELIARWHGRGRLVYTVTPRFAATSTERQLELAGKLLDEHPGLRLQTHIAENPEEIQWVKELFPWSKNYLDVYDRFGLVRPGALYGHCIHLDDTSWKRLAESGATAVHCPTSNLFLGSGLYDYDRAELEGVPTAIGTDVGGGTSFSMLRTLHEAYKVAQMGRRSFNALDAFYLATLGGARGLGLEDCIGNFDAGKEADFVVLDPDATPLLARRMATTKTLEEKLFVLMMLGDDRAIKATHVLGEKTVA